MTMSQPAEGTEPAQPDADTETQPSSSARWLASTWAYTIGRFAVFGALWGILLLAGLGGLIAALVAAVLSIPLSFVLLAKLRGRVAQQLQARVESGKQRRREMDARLDPNAAEES